MKTQKKNLDKKRKTQNIVIKKFNEKDKSNGLNIKKEKEQLISNVQMLVNELDDLTENNIIESKKINKLYKQILIFKSRKNYIDLKESFLQIIMD